MKCISVTWNPDEDETKVTLSKEFADSHWVTRADVLQDALIQLTNMYNKTLPSQATKEQ